MAFRLRFFLIIFVALAGLGLLLLGVSKQSSSGSILVIDLLDLMQEPKSFMGRELRVRAFVQTGSILRTSGDRASFVLEQSASKQAVHTLQVRYLGHSQLPDTFSDAAPVRVDGFLKKTDVLVLEAHKVEAKCASKYEVTELPYSFESGLTQPPLAPKLSQGKQISNPKK